MKIEKVSPISGKSHTMDLDVTVSQMWMIKNGAYIQNVLPHLTADEREFIITGITKEEWDETFPNRD